MKKIALITSCVFILMAAGFAVAGPHKGMPHGNQNRCDVIQSLNLSDEQTEKFKEIRAKRFEQTKGIRTEMHSKNAELDMLWKQANPDAQAIKNKMNEISDLQKQLNAISVDFRLECRGILTPEQLDRCLAEEKCGFGFSKGPGMKFDKDHKSKRLSSDKK